MPDDDDLLYIGGRPESGLPQAGGDPQRVAPRRSSAQRRTRRPTPPPRCEGDDASMIMDADSIANIAILSHLGAGGSDDDGDDGADALGW